MTGDDLTALTLTLKLAALTSLILLLIGLPLAWWLARTRSVFKAPIEALVALPIVLPPTVLGFYLLLALGPEGPVGGWWKTFAGDGLAFTFAGLVIGSTIYSLPFAVQPLQNAFESISERYLEAASTLRASPFDRFFSVVLPLARRGVLTALTLGFAHTLGEFGVVLMIGGNIPGETRVASIAIYDHVETLEYGAAHGLSAVLLILSFVILLAVYGLNRQRLGPARP